MEIVNYLIVFGVGVFTGFLNTLAGSGSLITLPLLIFMGLDANTANGTNRLALIMQTTTSVFTYKSKNLIRKDETVRFGVPAIIGSLIGATLAVFTKPIVLNFVIAVLLVVMVILLAFNPEKWLKSREIVCTPKRKAVQFLVFILIGIYGGYIQASAGFFWLAALVLISGLDLFRANIYKNLIIMLYMPFSFAVFAFSGQVNYFWGLLLGAGSVVGAYIGARTSVKKGSNLIRYLLLLAVLASAIKLIIG